MKAACSLLFFSIPVCARCLSQPQQPWCSKGMGDLSLLVSLYSVAWHLGTKVHLQENMILIIFLETTPLAPQNTRYRRSLPYCRFW